MVSNIFNCTPTRGNDPFWLIFFKWVETTNQFWILKQVTFFVFWDTAIRSWPRVDPWKNDAWKIRVLLVGLSKFSGAKCYTLSRYHDCHGTAGIKNRVWSLEKHRPLRKATFSIRCGEKERVPSGCLLTRNYVNVNNVNTRFKNHSKSLDIRIFMTFALNDVNVTKVGTSRPW